MAYRVFVSYASQDRQYWKGLESYLSPLKRNELISAWQVEDILPGQNKEQQILEQIQKAQIILLLISQHFIASDICYSVEMKEAIERDRRGEARVIPILLRPGLYKDTPFAALATLPRNKAISEYSKRDKAYVEVAEGIRAVINDLAKTQTVPVQEDHLAIRILEEKKQVWLIPFEQNEMFTGRSTLLEKLHTHLHNANGQVKAQVIYGLGGIGKTQTALEYAYRYRAEYEAVFWVRAESNDLLAGDFVGVAEAIGLPTKHIQDLNLIADSVKNWLRTNKGWLLILDNADDPERALKFVGRQLKGHVLLTSRNPSDGPGLQTIEIGEMNLEEGVNFLLRRTRYLEEKDLSEEEQAGAHEIVRIMGGLPLALVQAGAYIASMRCGMAGYIDRYKSRRALFLRDTRGLTEEHPESVAATWLLSFENVEKAKPASADLLRLCAFLQPDAIPEGMIRAGKQELTEALQVVAEDSVVWDEEAIYELLRYSLVRRQEGEILTVHRLVQDVLRERMDERGQKKWAEMAIGVVDLVFEEVPIFDEQNRRQQYVQHAQQCAIWIKDMHLESPQIVNFLIKVERYLRERGQYKEAEPLVIQTRILAEKIYGEASIEIASILSETAELYRLQGRYSEALRLAQRGLELHEQYTQSLVKIANSCNTLARVYHELAKYNEARALYERALVIREQKLGKNHPDVAESLNDLAVLYSHLENYKRAETLQKRALTIREKAYGTKHPDTALSISNLAIIYKNQGRNELAEPLYKQALELHFRLLGPEHPDTFTSLNNLASLYYDQGHYVLAEPLFQQARELSTRLLGPEHPRTIINLSNLASLYHSQKRYPQAESLYKQARSLRERILGPKHPDTAKTIYNLARFYVDRRNFKQAEHLFPQALKIFEETLGPTHPTTIAALMDYVALLRITHTRRVEQMQKDLEQRQKKAKEEQGVWGEEGQDEAKEE